MPILHHCIPSLLKNTRFIKYKIVPIFLELAPRVGGGVVQLHGGRFLTSVLIYIVCLYKFKVCECSDCTGSFRLVPFQLVN